MDPIPQPTKHAKEVYEIVAGAVCGFIPLLAALKPSMDVHLNKKLQRGEEVLLEAISERGVSAIHDEQFEFYVPAVYRFLEQVRIGEYEHNLKVLASLISRGLTDEGQQTDAGTIGRAARKLELISFSELQTLAATKKVWDQIAIDGPSLQNQGQVDYGSVLDAHAALGMPIEPHRLAENLHELTVRGLLSYSAPGTDFFGGGYQSTSAYREIIGAVLTIVHTHGDR